MISEERQAQVDKIKEQLKDKTLIPFVREGLSFAKALWAQARTPRGKRLVTPEILKKRLEICGSCPEMGKRTCLFCKCNVRLKCSWSTSSCGLGFWNKEV